MDAAIRSGLEELTTEDAEFWDFSDRRSRVEEARALFNYPAMMVGTMQRELMAVIAELQPGATTVGDPFVGSGVVLGEAMYLGLSAVGQDINPLAVLICQVKADCADADTVEAAGKAVVYAAKGRLGSEEIASRPPLAKWFRPGAAAELAALKHAIRSQPDPATRRFLWTTLAETVRLTSNSRTSTYKLHIRSAAAIAALPMPIATFSRLLARNVANHRAFLEALAFRKRLTNGRYTGSIQVRSGDTKAGFPVSCDMIVTSPPYGDNGTTVPYGQASYLPLQGVDASDVNSGVDQKLLAGAYEIDRRSLGGARKRGEDANVERLRQASPSLARCLDELKPLPRDRAQRVGAFFRDLDVALESIVQAVRSNGYLVLTVGNRRVGGRPVPMDDVLIELLEGRNTVHVGDVHRRIRSKRMANRNPLAATITRERTLLFRRHP